MNLRKIIIYKNTKLNNNNNKKNVPKLLPCT